MVRVKKPLTCALSALFRPPITSVHKLTHTHTHTLDLITRLRLAVFTLYSIAKIIDVYI